jgi:hypothetical protein
MPIVPPPGIELQDDGELQESADAAESPQATAQIRGASEVGNQ